MDGMDSISGADMAAGFADGFGSAGNNGASSGSSGTSGESGGVCEAGLGLNMSEAEACGSNLGGITGVGIDGNNNLGMSLNMSAEEAYGSDLDGIMANGMTGGIGLSPEAMALADPNNAAFSELATGNPTISAEMMGVVDSINQNIGMVQTDITTASDTLKEAAGQFGAIAGGVGGALAGIALANQALNTLGPLGLHPGARVGASVVGGVVGGVYGAYNGYTDTIGIINDFNDGSQGLFGEEDKR